MELIAKGGEVSEQGAEGVIPRWARVPPRWNAAVGQGAHRESVRGRRDQGTVFGVPVSCKPVVLVWPRETRFV